MIDFIYHITNEQGNKIQGWQLMQVNYCATIGFFDVI